MGIPHEEGNATRRRFGVAALVFTLLFVGLMGRYFYLQIVRGDEHRESARVSFTRHETLPARRGKIRDRDGEVLADNVERHSVAILPHAVRDPEARAEVLASLQRVLGLLDARVAELDAAIEGALEDDEAWRPLDVADGLVAQTCPHDGDALELDADAPREGFCGHCGAIHRRLPADATRCPHDGAPLAMVEEGSGATCTRCDRPFVLDRPAGGADDGPATCVADGHALAPTQRNLICPTCERRFVDQIAVLSSRAHDLPGVRLSTELRRIYPHPHLAPHVLGSVNKVTAEDRARNPDVYGLDARIGRSGVERALEPTLRGEAGYAEYFTGASEDVPARYEPSQNGRDVWLTIDAGLQRTVRQALRYHRSGGAVVVDPRSGEILASYSTPGFDPNAWSGRLSREAWERIRDNPYAPLMDKVVTAYAPGSVYKIVTAVAGLDRGLVTPEDTFHCPGHYDFGGRRFHCHLREGGHGHVNLVDAMKYSCDVYFYKLGEQLSMDVLAEYGRAFGFGEPTGVELAERTGVVPTKAIHAATPLGWQPGFTLSTAIGQGSLTASPLQVARSFAAIANGGRLLQMRMVKQYTDEDGELVQRFLPAEMGRLPGTPSQWAVVREGLVRVVNDRDGTAPNVAMDAVVVAGKTGTAEAPQTRPGAGPELRRWLEEDHAWFAAYAPADDPQVVVTVFVEHGGGGSTVAAPIAKRILEAWMRTDLYTPAPTPTSAAREGEGDGRDLEVTP